MTTLTLSKNDLRKKVQDISCTKNPECEMTEQSSGRISEYTEGLNALRKDAAVMQRRGLPFMMASVVLWTGIMLSRIFMKDIHSMNLFVFMTSSFLMPVATIFGKIIKADIYKKTSNPVNKLGFLCNINQFLYLPIAMWAFSDHPHSMLLIYAIIFAAHLLPFSWVYDSKIYFYGSIIESVGVIFVAYAFGYPVATAFIVIMQIIVCIGLIRDIRRNDI